MIERASRTVTAERVEPGNLVMREGKLLTVATTTIGADAVVLVGKLPGRDKGTAKMQVDRGADVELVADDALLDLIEQKVLRQMEPRIAGDDEAEDICISAAGLVVAVAGETWIVPLRPTPKVTTEVGSFEGPKASGTSAAEAADVIASTGA